MYFSKKFSKTFLFSLLSSSLITPVFANTSNNDFFWYGYSFGGMTKVCSLYKSNKMSKKDAKQEVNISLNNGKRYIKNPKLFKALKESQAEGFAKHCEDLM